VPLLIAAVLSAAACVADHPAPATAPSTQPLTVGPISYFEDHCARCHGSFGSGYLPESMKRHDPAALKKLIRDMAAGPAQAPLEGTDLDAQAAYHQSLLKKSLFVAVTESTDEQISGEASPGAKLKLIVPGRTIDLPLDDFLWTISTKDLSPSELENAQLNIRRDGEEVVLPLSTLLMEKFQ